MRERALRLRAQKLGLHPECSKLAALEPAEALLGTKARVALEPNSARARMTKGVEFLRRLALAPVQVKRKKAVKAQGLLAERWLPGQPLTHEPVLRAPQELRKQKPEPA